MIIAIYFFIIEKLTRLATPIPPSYSAASSDIYKLTASKDTRVGQAVGGHVPIPRQDSRTLLVRGVSPTQQLLYPSADNTTRVRRINKQSSLSGNGVS